MDKKNVGVDPSVDRPVMDYEQWYESSGLNGENQNYLESQYEQFISNDNSEITPNIQKLFSDIAPTDTQESLHSKFRQKYLELVKHKVQTGTPATDTTVELWINQYRIYGHMIAKIDPLNTRIMPSIEQLQLSYHNLSGEKNVDLLTIEKKLQRTYCGPVASEYMHIVDLDERTWIQEQVEQNIAQDNIARDEKLHILELLTSADGLEKYLGTQYPGAKRFGLEGAETLIIALDRIIQNSGAKGVQEIMLGMAHRGRLNVLVNVLGKSPKELFEEFEGKYSSKLSSGDVKYHQGFAADIKTPGGPVHLSLAFNPSHLEIVDPVLCGSVRARMDRYQDTRKDKILSILIHGDAAFAGQGVVMETLNLSRTKGYSIGGTIHIIVNNQIGFTTDPSEGRSTMYCSDLAKMLQSPVFHVNADYPEEVFKVATLALEYRMRYHSDVVIDLVGYRRQGHNEADEPAVTQPLMYQKIRQHIPVRTLYANELMGQGIISSELNDHLIESYRQLLDKRESQIVKLVNDWEREHVSNWIEYFNDDWRISFNNTVSIAQLKQLAELRDRLPENFVVHKQLERLLEHRRNMTNEGDAIDWGYAETLAYATLVIEGRPVRLSGQDVGRGTFFHRHVEWHDQVTGAVYVSLNNLSAYQGKFEIINSTLSEAAVLGFEYGYSTAEPRGLVIWEAQFGDFANGAQVVIDQFITSGEVKWGRLSGLVMLLPHGYEGQGPEHSSARLERYLQLCADHNIQVCIPTTPAQIYHLLRRQVLRPMRKPLIVFTPKSLLRHKLAISSLEDLANGNFKLVISETELTDVSKINRVIICSGKVYYDLITERTKLKLNNIAIIRIEQLYPFPEPELSELLAQYHAAQAVYWCQEEPKNQGAWYSSQHHFIHCLAAHQKLYYAGRAASASPAVGYEQVHKEQQAKLIEQALGVNLNGN